MAPTAVCELSSGACVQCTATNDAACTGTSPVCGNEHACRACQAHSECATNACLPDGSCADEASVAYVDPTATNNPACSLSTPCNKVASALSTNRPYVKITGTIDEAITLDGTRTVTFLGAPGAKLTRTNNGQLLRIADAARVAIYDLEISGALGANVGISMSPGNTAALSLVRAKVIGNTGGGVSASGGSLTISQSTIAGNAGGGVKIDGAQFDITNTIIAKNGSVSTSYGGMLVSQTNTGTRRFEFNTVTENGGMTGATTGVLCNLIGQPMTFSNNIIYGNQVIAPGAQAGGVNCTWTYSDIGPDAVSGTGNINADPMFVNAAQDNYHIAATSPCKDAADPAATITSDMDGETRPHGPARDIGADEVVR